MSRKNHKGKRKAKNLFIHKQMQREFSLVLIALLIVASFAISFTIHFTIREAAFGGGALQFGKVNPYQVLSEVSYKMIARATVILFLTLIFLATYGIKFLHRVAGPMYRIRKTLIYLNNGDITQRIKLRKGDYFTEVADEVNQQAELREQQAVKLSKVTQAIENSLAKAVSPEAKEELQKAKDILSK